MSYDGYDDWWDPATGSGGVTGGEAVPSAPTDPRGMPGPYPGGTHGQIITGSGGSCSDGSPPVHKYVVGEDGVSRPQWVCPDGSSPSTGGGSSSRPPSGGPGGGGGRPGLGGGFSYTTPPFTGATRPQYTFGPAPQFDAPDFDAPDADSIYSDPSYQFRLNQGLGALESSAAARGVLRSGGTLKGVQDYAQDYASQEYNNIYNRALQDWNARFQSAAAEFAPKFSEWQTRADADIGAGNLAFQAALDRYFFGINDQFRREKMIFDAGAP